MDMDKEMDMDVFLNMDVSFKSDFCDFASTRWSTTDFTKRWLLDWLNKDGFCRRILFFWQKTLRKLPRPRVISFL